MMSSPSTIESSPTALKWNSRLALAFRDRIAFDPDVGKLCDDTNILNDRILAVISYTHNSLMKRIARELRELPPQQALVRLRLCRGQETVK